MTVRLDLMLKVAGVLQFGVLTASFLVPRVLNWRETLKPLPTLVRQLTWVYGGYVVLMIISLGAVSLGLPHELTLGSGLARAVCAFGAVFWGVRLALQLFYLDSREFLTTWVLRAGHEGLTVVFAFLTVVFTLAAIG
ncbi:MAG: hypothetical protein KDA93_25150 [Planctomycetaceae bacterium]|nr:hypothetical protein [Planctomycetaceae bacterium]